MNCASSIRFVVLTVVVAILGVQRVDPAVNHTPGTDCKDLDPCGTPPPNVSCDGPAPCPPGISPVFYSTPKKNQTTTPGSGNVSIRTTSPCYTEMRGYCTVSCDTDPVNDPIPCPDGVGGCCCVTVWDFTNVKPHGSYTECYTPPPP